MLPFPALGQHVAACLMCGKGKSVTVHSQQKLTGPESFHIDEFAMV